jgi:hypothetical protein
MPLGCPRLQNVSDGVDVWESMSTGTPSPRQEILLNLIPTGCQRADNNCTIGGQLALRQGPWKLLLGHTSVWGENSGTPSSLCAVRSNKVWVEWVGRAARKCFAVAFPPVFISSVHHTLDIAQHAARHTSNFPAVVPQRVDTAAREWPGPHPAARRGLPATALPLPRLGLHQGRSFPL